GAPVPRAVDPGTRSDSVGAGTARRPVAAHAARREGVSGGGGRARHRVRDPGDSLEAIESGGAAGTTLTEPRATCLSLVRQHTERGDVGLRSTRGASALSDSRSRTHDHLDRTIGPPIVEANGADPRS